MTSEGVSESPTTEPACDPPTTEPGVYKLDTKLADGARARPYGLAFLPLHAPSYWRLLLVVQALVVAAVATLFVLFGAKLVIKTKS